TGSRIFRRRACERTSPESYADREDRSGNPKYRRSRSRAARQAAPNRRDPPPRSQGAAEEAAADGGSGAPKDGDGSSAASGARSTRNDMSTETIVKITTATSDPHHPMGESR